MARGPVRIWAAATETFLRMVNDHLSPRQSDRALALDAGDLHVVFLPPSIVPFFPPDEGRPAPQSHMPARDGATDGPLP